MTLSVGTSESLCRAAEVLGMKPLAGTDPYFSSQAAIIAEMARKIVRLEAELKLLKGAE